MYRFLLFLVPLFFSVSKLSAMEHNGFTSDKKEHTVMLNGHVYDSFTKAALKAKVALMTPDSTVVDTLTSDAWQTYSSFSFKVPARAARYIIRASCEGYEDSYVDYELKRIARNTYFELPDNLMKKRQNDDIYKSVTLDGITVTGTKVKIAYRGDTVVYNASAFDLPEGSMLDGLVRQLPGAQLKSNGDIYINGKKIDYLTLNGKDFFKGDNKVMLDNLPYFTVKDIKVYHKSSEQSRWQGKEVEKKDYVMDVSLKREYSRGYLASAELAGGTAERYLARLFGLVYTDHSRYSVFANANNINDNMTQPGADGDFSSTPSPIGRQSSKSAGFSLSTEDKDKHFEERLDVSTQWNDASNESRTSSETFAASGNIFGKNISKSNQSDFRMYANNMFTVNKPFKLFSSLNLNYNSSESFSSNRSATYSGNPSSAGSIVQILDSTFSDIEGSDLVRLVSNRSDVSSFVKNRSLGLSGNVSFMHKLPWGDQLQLSVSGNYNDHKPADSFSRTRTDYLKNLSSDFRNIYSDTHGSSYSYNMSAGYIVNFLNKWSVSANLGYGQRHTSSNNLNYRLDKLSGDWGIGTAKPLGEHPSTRDSLLLALDARNTTRSSDMFRTVSSELQIYKGNDKMFFSVSLPLKHVSERLHYEGGAVDTIASRSASLFTPSLRFYSYGEKSSLSLNYSLSLNQPDLVGMMPYDNDINPLARLISNSNLKNSVTHLFSSGYDLRWPGSQQSLGFYVGANINADALGMRTTFNSKTGAYTYMQDNVSGNWSVNGIVNFMRPLDKAKRLSLSTSLNADYNHSVDFDIAYDAKSTALSTVHNLNLTENLTLAYTYGEFTAGLSAWGSWRNSTSDRDNFTTINSFDFNYGGNLTCKLPFGFTFATDFKVYSRRGYQDRNMNTDDMVWNASLGRSFLKGRLMLRLNAYDILHELSSTYYNINAQGRTEVWNNTFSRFVMLHVAYKFTMSPKK